MNIEMVRSFFMWSTLINYGILIFWSGLFIFAHDPLKALNDKIIRCKIQQFDTIQYAGIAFYKIIIIFFNLVPWIVLSTLR